MQRTTISRIGKTKEFLSVYQVLALVFFSLALMIVMARVSEAATATGRASVEIVVPLNVIMGSPLEFGNIKSEFESDDEEEESGSVTITTGNQRLASGNIKVSSQFNRAVFTINGVPYSTYNIQISDLMAVHDQTLKPESGVTQLRILDLKSFSVSAGLETTTGKINASGTDTVYVGGTLLVPATAKNGKYRGDVEIILSY